VIDQERFHERKKEFLILERSLSEFGRFSYRRRKSDVKVPDRGLGRLEKLVLKPGRIIRGGIRFDSATVRTGPAGDRNMASESSVRGKIEQAFFTA
jgi:hypothetical protein